MPAVVVLAGGTGGAKLARGMLDVVGDDLTVIANTADDIEIYGAYVSPDPDLCTFWLADLIDERGWGLRDDSFAVMDGLRELGIGRLVRARRPRPRDRDPAPAAPSTRARASPTRWPSSAPRSASTRACCRWPTSRSARGCARGERWMSLQEFLIRAGHDAPVEGTVLARHRGGAPDARGPRRDRRGGRRSSSDRRTRSSRSGRSSRYPTCATPCRAAPHRSSPSRRSSAAPCSRGRRRRSWRRRAIRRRPRAWPRCYAGLIDGLVADEPADGLPVLQTDTLMSDPESRRRVAAETLRFAEALA